MDPCLPGVAAGTIPFQAALRRRPSTLTEEDVIRPRAADDFATTRARLEELRREREYAERADIASEAEPVPVRTGRTGPIAIVIRRPRDAAG